MKVGKEASYAFFLAAPKLRSIAVGLGNLLVVMTLCCFCKSVQVKTI